MTLTCTFQNILDRLTNDSPDFQDTSIDYCEFKDEFNSFTEMSTSLPRSCRQVLHRHSRTISRSVSDVASATLSEEIRLEETDDLSPAFSSPQLCHNDDVVNVFDDTVEDDDNAAFTGFDSAHYRGFLLRHGSYEVSY